MRPDGDTLQHDGPRRPGEPDCATVFSSQAGEVGKAGINGIGGQGLGGRRGPVDDDVGLRGIEVKQAAPRHFRAHVAVGLRHLGKTFPKHAVGSAGGADASLHAGERPEEVLPVHRGACAGEERVVAFIHGWVAGGFHGNGDEALAALGAGLAGERRRVGEGRVGGPCNVDGGGKVVQGAAGGFLVQPKAVDDQGDAGVTLVRVEGSGVLGGRLAAIGGNPRQGLAGHVGRGFE